LLWCTDQGIADAQYQCIESLSALRNLRPRMREEPALFVALSEIGLRAQRDPAIHVAVQERVEAWHAFLVGILTAGIKQGSWPEELDVEAVASAIIALVQSVSLHSRLLPHGAEQAVKQLERWPNL
jgi:hypothetical protein